MEDLNKLRQSIDKIDDQIVELISERFSYTNEIGLIKAQKKLPLLDKEREAQIISRLTEKASSLSLDPDLISSIFRSILSEVVQNHKASAGSSR